MRKSVTKGILLKYLRLSGAKACKSCRSRQELSNEYFLAKFGVDTEGNEPYKVLHIYVLRIFANFPKKSRWCGAKASHHSLFRIIAKYFVVVVSCVGLGWGLGSLILLWG